MNALGVWNILPGDTTGEINLSLLVGDIGIDDPVSAGGILDFCLTMETLNRAWLGMEEMTFRYGGADLFWGIIGVAGESN